MSTIGSKILISSIFIKCNGKQISAEIIFS